MLREPLLILEFPNGFRTDLYRFWECRDYEPILERPGIQYKGANYLIPINANMHSASDVEYECTDLGRVLDKLDESGCKMKIIALDACRNNPFERSWYRGSADRGLSAVNAPVGTFISYATSPGSVAADGQNRNSSGKSSWQQIASLSAAMSVPMVTPSVQHWHGLKP